MVLFMDSKTAMECFHKFSISISHGGVGQFKVCLEVVDDNMNLIGHVQIKVVIEVIEIVFKVCQNDLIVRINILGKTNSMDLP